MCGSADLWVRKEIYGSLFYFAIDLLSKLSSAIAISHD